MLKNGAGLLLGLVMALPVAAQQPTAEAQPEKKTFEQVLASFREELQAAETDIVSKMVSFSTDEATKFWPVFKNFQSEQKVIIDGQIAALRKYAAEFETLSGEGSLAYVNSLLERDQQIHDLRVKYLSEYSKVLPPGKAARVVHLSRKLGVQSQATLAAEIPLVR